MIDYDVLYNSIIIIVIPLLLVFPFDLYICLFVYYISFHNL